MPEDKAAEYVDDLRKRLKDPAYAAEYLSAVLEDDEEGSDAVFLLALRDVAAAFQMSKLAGQAGVSRESLYRTLSGKGNPKLSNLLALMRALGLRLSVQSLPPVAQSPSGKVVAPRRQGKIPAQPLPASPRNLRRSL